ncbi:acyl-CoA dehydrogenase family protein [Thermogymnomonas acidicola]|uniref:acyl-CoA dehydrogenase family protein n=1 Tax=Thermogymnomonas acidicola TaxID=399579 RepID=UPI001396C7D3|nr:acyl-CoA dehydrogenase family protein [Thermogymnomonas acidicola]
MRSYSCYATPQILSRSRPYRPRVNEIEEGGIPDDLLGQLRAQGFYAALIPQEAGGAPDWTCSLTLRSCTPFPG